jgi:uncharacterized protein (TIGR03089 family)
MPDDIASVLAAAVRRDPARPLLTWYDDATGERTELSGATLANWVAKTANLLVDGLGLVPGDRAGVRLPPHWQTAGVLLGCWSAGVSVVDPPDGGDASAGVDVVFASAARLDEVDAADRFVLSLHPFGLPMRDVPPGWQDYNQEVRAYGDHFAPTAPLVVPGDPDGLTSGDRVLVDAAAHPDPAEWLVGPLAAGASIVLCGNRDPSTLEARIAAEQVTTTRL